MALTRLSSQMGPTYSETPDVGKAYFASKNEIKGSKMINIINTGKIRKMSKAISEEYNYYCTQILNGDKLIKLGISSVVGAFLGIIASLLVNCTLVEVSLSPFFAMYFGALFITVGVVIIWRIHGTNSEQSDSRKSQLTFFATLIIVSGILCFILEQNWFVGLNRVAKIPTYMLLGISIAFALTFSIVDLVNYSIGLCQHTLARPLVASKNQVFLVLTFSLIKGALFGFVFGVMDIEDEVSYHIRLALLKEQHFCYPLGAVLGALAGLGNEYIRQKEDYMNTQQLGEFDEEI